MSVGRIPLGKIRLEKVNSIQNRMFKNLAIHKCFLIISCVCFFLYMSVVTPQHIPQLKLMSFKMCFSYQIYSMTNHGVLFERLNEQISFILSHGICTLSLINVFASHFMCVSSLVYFFRFRWRSESFRQISQLTANSYDQIRFGTLEFFVLLQLNFELSRLSIGYFFLYRHLQSISESEYD